MPFIRKTLASDWVTNPHVDPAQADPLIEVRLIQTKDSGNMYEILTDFDRDGARSFTRATEKYQAAVKFWQSERAVPRLLARGPDGVRF
jgi:hypothetical protein